MIELIICLAFVVLAVVLLQKGFTNTFVFLALGVILAVIVQLKTGGSVAAKSSGLLAFDVFEAIKEQFTASFGSVGLAMLPIYGYSTYMTKIQASSVFGSLVAKPVAKSKNPYFVGVAIAVIICGLMRIAIVSAFAIMALLFSTLYPAMLKAGLSKKTTMAAIFIGTCFDWGPADFVVAQVLGGAGETDIAGYFLSASVYVTPIALVVVGLLSGLILKWWDNKDGYVFGSDAPTEEAASEGMKVPASYAILPLLPLILIIVFSKVFFASISISVVTAVLISMIVSLCFELIRKGKIKERVADMGEWLTGMGQGFANLFLMVASIQFFAGMLAKLGGFTYLVNIIIGTGVSGWILFFIIGVFVMLMAVLMGDASAITAVLAGQVMTLSTGLGIPFYAAILPIQTANAFRALSIGTGVHMQYCAKYAECSPIDLMKRAVVPCVLIYLIVFAGSMIIL